MNPYKKALQDLCYAVDELMCVLTETGADIDEETGLRYSDIAKVDTALERAENLLATEEN